MADEEAAAAVLDVRQCPEAVVLQVKDPIWRIVKRDTPDEHGVLM